MTPGASLIEPSDALSFVAEALQVHGGEDATIASLALISQAIRRATHVLAPCPKHEIEAAVVQSLRPFSSSFEQLQGQVVEATEALLGYGELHEMNSPGDALWTACSPLVRPGYPAFVPRKDGSVIILGVAGDELTALPGELNQRLRFRGVLRILTPQAGEALAPLLTELGLAEFSEKAWLHLPGEESAACHRERWLDRLQAGTELSSAENLVVVDTRKTPSFYAGRWVSLSAGMSGIHVGRRAQKYGAPLWCIVDLVDGRPQRFFDLAQERSRYRPCDLAWRLQMALDELASAPQRFRQRSLGAETAIDFFSPIPSWAERKFAVLGERSEPHRCLLTYTLPNTHAQEAINFAKSYLWIASDG